jgi:HK97 family phage major capsid protein
MKIGYSSIGTWTKERVDALMRARAVTDLVKAENRDFTAEEKQKVDDLLAKAEKLRDRIRQSEADDELRKTVASWGYGNAPAGAPGLWAKAWQAANAGRKMAPPSGSILVPTMVAPGLAEVPETLLALIPRTPLTDGDSYSYLVETVRTHAAAPVKRGSVKPTSTYTVTRTDGQAQTIAHLSPPMDRAWLADFGGLGAYLDNAMCEGLTLAVENQILNGSGAAPQLPGVWNTAGVLNVAFDTDAITSLRVAITALQEELATPTGVVMSPDDWETIELTTEGTNGAYRLATPTQPVPVDSANKRIWGVRVVLSTMCPLGYAVIGDWRKAMIWEREAVVLEWHDGQDPSDNSSLFAKNQYILRAETRLGFGVMRPNALAIVDLSVGS